MRISCFFLLISFYSMFEQLFTCHWCTKCCLFSFMSKYVGKMSISMLGSIICLPMIIEQVIVKKWDSKDERFVKLSEEEVSSLKNFRYSSSSHFFSSSFFLFLVGDWLCVQRNLLWSSMLEASHNMLANKSDNNSFWCHLRMFSMPVELQLVYCTGELWFSVYSFIGDLCWNWFSFNATLFLKHIYGVHFYCFRRLVSFSKNDYIRFIWRERDMLKRWKNWSLTDNLALMHWISTEIGSAYLTLLRRVPLEELVCTLLSHGLLVFWRWELRATSEPKMWNPWLSWL